MFHRPPTYPESVHISLRVQLKQIIKDTLLKKIPFASNIQFKHVWTEAGDKHNTIVADFEYSYSNEDTNVQVTGGATLVKKSLKSSKEHNLWVVRSIRTDDTTMDFEHPIVLLPGEEAEQDVDADAGQGEDVDADVDADADVGEDAGQGADVDAGQGAEQDADEGEGLQKQPAQNLESHTDNSSSKNNKVHSHDKSASEESASGNKSSSETSSGDESGDKLSNGKASSGEKSGNKKSGNEKPNNEKSSSE